MVASSGCSSVNFLLPFAKQSCKSHVFIDSRAPHVDSRLIHERNLQVDCAKVDGITVADADLHKGLRVPPEQLGHLAISTPLPP
mmetsp:Transcript_6131/g.20009  ORF Transcript_6131/g.20009 Transcript_6131/m.20009 type:complete len:84 (+) Transcript_6131:546-797(+)